MATKAIAKEQYLMFSRVGLPATILTEQGTPFMSRLMKDLSLIPGQTNKDQCVPPPDGRAELNHQKHATQGGGPGWEVPQASTGFAPFELLYGRPCRGNLDLAKESWGNQPCQYCSFIEHVTTKWQRYGQWCGNTWPKSRKPKPGRTMERHS